MPVCFAGAAIVLPGESLFAYHAREIVLIVAGITAVMRAPARNQGH